MSDRTEPRIDVEDETMRTGWLEHWPPNAQPSRPDKAAIGGPGRPDPGATARVWAGSDGSPILSDERRRSWGFAPGAELEATRTADGITFRPVDPPISKIYVEPTSRCNLSCRTCVRHSWSEPVGTMSMDTFARLVDGLREVPTLRTVAFWGFGEPLLHPEIGAMIAAVKSLGAETELITNALLLDEALAERLVSAGLDRLVVSIDGVSPEAQADVRSGASLQTVIENLKGLGRVRRSLERDNPTIGLEFVAMRRNVHELPKLRALSREIDARFVVVTNVIPYTPDMRSETLYGSSVGQSKREATRWTPEIRTPRLDTRSEILEPLLRLLSDGDSLAPSPDAGRGAASHCRFVNEGSAAISWDGELSPCVALMHSYTAYVFGREKHFRRYALGNVTSEAIAAIWARDDFRDFRRRVRDFTFSPCTDCGGCDLAGDNESDCYGNPFPTCGDCLWAKGVINCP